MHWEGQDTGALPPWPVCAGHREAVMAPLNAPGVKELWEQNHKLSIVEVTDGKCALGAFGNCCEDPVTEIPSLDVKLLEG